MRQLEEITYPIPDNYSRTPIEIKVEGRVEFVGFLHRINDIDGIEGMHDQPIRLESGGKCFEIPAEWLKFIPKHYSQRELVRC